MIKLQNGATVLAADIATTADGYVRGYVLARTTHGEYVTWSVGRHGVDGPLETFHGNYFSRDLTEAMANYDARRAYMVK